MQSKKKMKELDDLHQYLEQRQIAVLRCDFSRFQSVSLKDSDGDCHIGIDTRQLSSSEELCLLAHEAGHCETGSFYNPHSPFDLRSKHEHRADRWAFDRLCPEPDLRRLIRSGTDSLSEIAEHFSVTEDFLIRALKYYRLL